MLFALKLICFIAGTFLLSYVLLAYEDDEKKAQSWFKAAWEALHAGEKSISQRINVHLVMLSSAISQVLARIYGARLLSLRVPAAQVTMMLAAALIFGGAIAMLPESVADERTLADRAFGLGFWLLAVPFLLAAWSRDGRWVVFFAACTVVPLPIAAFLGAGKQALQLALLLAFALALDVVVTSVVRKMLADVSAKDPLRRTAFRLTVATLVAPILVGAAAATPGLVDGAVATLDDVLPGWTGFLLLMCAVSLLTSGLLLVVVTASSIYRLFYAIAPRAVHSFAVKFKVLENRKVGAAVGIVLITPLVPSFAPLMEKVTKALAG